jgi:hypothetical protein
LIILIMLREEYRLWSSSLWSFLHGYHCHRRDYTGTDFSLISSHIWDHNFHTLHLPGNHALVWGASAS